MRAREIRARALEDPLRWIKWLPVQLRYLQEHYRFRLFRAGNQSVGKTTAGLADMLMDAMGTHPYRASVRIPRDRKEREYWLVCASWQQSPNIQAKLHALIPPDRMHPDAEFDPVKGFRGRQPAVKVRHEDGTWSIIKIKTARQGTLDLAGGSICGVLFDEVPRKQDHYSECVKRVQAVGGWVSICATMVGAPVDWLREEAEEGRIADIHTRLTPDALIPVGYHHPIRLEDGTVCDEAWIRRIEAETPPHEREVRIHGGWEIRFFERYFAAFVSDPAAPNTHVSERLPRGAATIVIGIDHGSRPGAQTAVLMAVEEPTLERPYPRIYVLDEYVDESGNAIPEQDAAGVLAMLRRRGLKWGNVDFVGGDIPHMQGDPRQKSNRDLMVQLGKQLGIPWRQLRPQIVTIKRGKGKGGHTRGYRLRWLYHQMVRDGGFSVHPRCTRVIESLDRHATPNDEWSHQVDAIAYGLDRHAFRTVAR